MDGIEMEHFDDNEYASYIGSMIRTKSCRYGIVKNVGEDEGETVANVLYAGDYGKGELRSLHSLSIVGPIE